MLTDPGDIVIDPFAGSCVTGEVCERLGRRWVCVELVEDYLKGALGRFQRPEVPTLFPMRANGKANTYRLHHPAALWSDDIKVPLAMHGGKFRFREKGRVTSAYGKAKALRRNGTASPVLKGRSVGKVRVPRNRLVGIN